MKNLYRYQGKTDDTQLEGLITCIPKCGKIRNNRKNWPPTSNPLHKVCILGNKDCFIRIYIFIQKVIYERVFIGKNSRLIY